MKLLYKLTSANARPLVKGSELAAGFDLCSSKCIKIASKNVAHIPTDIDVILPRGCYGRIAARSGMSLKKSVTVLENNFIIEEKKNVTVTLYNFGNEDYNVKKGDRIAQLICEIADANQIPIFSPIEVDIPSQSVISIPINVKLQFPLNYYGRITNSTTMPPSSLVTVLEDIVVDGKLKISLYNFGATDYKINKGSKIAQIITEKIICPKLCQFKSTTTTTTTTTPPPTMLMYKKLNNSAIAPKPSSSQLGFNIYSPDTIIIPSGKVVCIFTNLQFILPKDDCYGRIASTRENISNFTTVLGGVIDKDYVGNVGVILYNFGKNERTIRRGENIARIICENIYYPRLMPLLAIHPHCHRHRPRGKFGFGSTGR